MPSATINYENEMKGWPPKTFLVNLDEPIVRFNPDTGEQLSYDWVAITIQEAEPQQAMVRITNEAGEMTQESMLPIKNLDHGPIHVVVSNLGYALVN